MPSYDAKLRGVIATWRYRPLVIAGKPLRVCTGVVFVYRQDQGNANARLKI